MRNMSTLLSKWRVLTTYVLHWYGDHQCCLMVLCFSQVKVYLWQLFLSLQYWQHSYIIMSILATYYYECFWHYCRTSRSAGVHCRPRAFGQWKTWRFWGVSYVVQQIWERNRRTERRDSCQSILKVTMRRAQLLKPRNMRRLCTGRRQIPESL